jgi:hypothetical protein
MFDEGIAATQPDESKRMRAFDLAELLEVTAVDHPPDGD